MTGILGTREGETLLASILIIEIGPTGMAIAVACSFPSLASGVSTCGSLARCAVNARGHPYSRPDAKPFISPTFLRSGIGMPIARIDEGV